MNLSDPSSNPLLNQYLASLKRPAVNLVDNNQVFYGESNFGLFIDNTLQGVNGCIVALKFLEKFPLKYLNADTTVLNFELCRLRKNLLEERSKYVNTLNALKTDVLYQQDIAKLVACNSKIDEQYTNCTVAKQSYKPRHHNYHGVHCVKYLDQYQNVSQTIIPPQNLLASVTSVPQLVTSTSAPPVISTDNNIQSHSFYSKYNKLHNPRPTESNYQLFQDSWQFQAEKSVTFAIQN